MKKMVPEYEPKKCVNCNGYGTLGHARVRCPSCHGKGVLLIPLIAVENDDEVCGEKEIYFQK